MPTSHVVSLYSPIYVCMQGFCNASFVMSLHMQYQQIVSAVCLA